MSIFCLKKLLNKNNFILTNSQQTKQTGSIETIINRPKTKAVDVNEQEKIHENKLNKNKFSNKNKAGRKN